MRRRQTECASRLRASTARATMFPSRLRIIPRSAAVRKRPDLSMRAHTSSPSITKGIPIATISCRRASNRSTSSSVRKSPSISATSSQPITAKHSRQRPTTIGRTEAAIPTLPQRLNLRSISAAKAKTAATPRLPTSASTTSCFPQRAPRHSR